MKRRSSATLNGEASARYTVRAIPFSIPLTSTPWRFANVNDGRRSRSDRVSLLVA